MSPYEVLLLARIARLLGECTRQVQFHRSGRPALAGDLAELVARLEDLAADCEAAMTKPVAIALDVGLVDDAG